MALNVYTRKEWTEDEERELARMWRGRLGAKRIATELDRSVASVRGKKEEMVKKNILASRFKRGVHGTGERLDLRLEPGLYDRLAREASKRGMSRTSLVINLIESALP